ncbi:MAG: chemotaxis protein [Clostridia bacterium]|jgi:methyl-accepting chemotaxis protein|nr:chemotaxis protein [Clostridia bacterium]
MEIEAARAGEAGRGFSIVAQEIRKLSSYTGKSVNDIKEVLKKIQDSVTEISNNINESNEIFQEQAAAVQLINASVQEITSTANYLEDIASKF